MPGINLLVKAVPVRAISRTVSPARSRTSACRYSNISILLRPTGLLLPT